MDEEVVPVLHVEDAVRAVAWYRRLRFVNGASVRARLSVVSVAPGKASSTTCCPRVPAERSSGPTSKPLRWPECRGERGTFRDVRDAPGIEQRHRTARSGKDAPSDTVRVRDGRPHSGTKSTRRDR